MAGTTTIGRKSAGLDRGATESRRGNDRTPGRLQQGSYSSRSEFRCHQEDSAGEVEAMYCIWSKINCIWNEFYRVGSFVVSDSQILVSSVLLIVLFKPFSYNIEKTNLPFLQDM